MLTFPFLKKLSATARLKQGVAFLRIFTGLIFSVHGWEKINDPMFSVNLYSILEGWALTNPFFWYQDFLNYIAAPNAKFFGFLVSYGEFAIGVSFVTGFLVQFSALACLLMNLNFFLATQHLSPASSGVNIAFMLIAFTLFWVDAGKYFGLDGLDFKLNVSPKPEKMPSKKSSKKSSLSQSKTKTPKKSATKKKSGKAKKQDPQKTDVVKEFKEFIPGPGDFDGLDED